MSILSRLSRLRGAIPTKDGGGEEIHAASGAHAQGGVGEEEGLAPGRDSRLMLKLSGHHFPAETASLVNNIISIAVSENSPRPLDQKPWRSVGEVHRSYRERTRGTVERAKEPGTSHVTVRQEPTTTHRAPFYSGGRIASQKINLLENGRSRRRRTTAEEDREEARAEETWELPSPPRQDAQASVAPNSVLVDNLDYSAYCLDTGGYRQSLLKDLRRLLREEHLTCVLMTKPEDARLAGEGAILLKTVFMAGVAALTTNSDGIFPEISREERGDTVSFRMVLNPKQRG